MSRKTEKHGNQDPTVKLSVPYEYSDGDDAEALIESIGFELYPWQKTIVTDLLGRDKNDNLTTTSAGILVPRQNGKNFLLYARVFYGIVANQELIWWTSHEVKSFRKDFEWLLENIFENEHHPEYNALVKRIRRTNGQEAIELVNGGRISFSARTHATSRGQSEDVIIFDEAQELTDDQFAPVRMIVRASEKSPQLIYTGTPPNENSHGDVFERQRDIALKLIEDGVNDGNKRAWYEWSLERHEDPYNPENWWKTNPSMGYRISEESVKEEMRDMTEDDFAREGLGVWIPKSEVDAVIDNELWQKSRVNKAPDKGVEAYGIKFSVDGKYVAVSAALKPKGKPTHIELVFVEQMYKGYTWIADLLANKKDEIAAIAIDGLSYSQNFANALRERDVPKKAIMEMNTRDIIESSSLFLENLTNKSITHIGQEALDAAVRTTTKRPIGKHGGFGFDGEDAPVIESAVLANWAVRKTKRRPGRRMKIL